MDDLAANIDGRAECLQCNLDDIDGAHHARAKAARLGQKNLDRTLAIQVASHSSVLTFARMP